MTLFRSASTLTQCLLVCLILVPRFGFADEKELRADAPPAVAAVLARKAAANAVFAAAEKGDAAELKTLLQAQPQLLQSRDHWGATLLTRAAASGEKAMPVVQFLLNQGSDVNEANSEGRRPLDYAISSGNADLVRLVLNRGARIDDAKYPPLLSAISSYQRDILQLLLDKGASINARNGRGQGVLHIAGTFGHLKDIKFWVEHGADVNARDNEGKTPLATIGFSVMSTAIYRETVEYLVGHGADPKARTRMGNSLIHQAILDRSLYGGVDRVGVLIEKGVDPTSLNGRGESALHLALRTSSPSAEFLKNLIEKSDLSARDQNGLTPLLMTIVSDYAAAREAIIARRAPVGDDEQLFDAATRLDSSALQELLRAKPYLAQLRLPNGATALHLAAQWNAFDAVKDLIAAGADPNARDAQARTPLHLAVRVRRDTNTISQSDARATVKALLARGADAAARDADDNTPLHLTAGYDMDEQSRALIEAWEARGLELDAPNKKGQTPLTLLLQSRKDNVASRALARLLFEKGFEPRATDSAALLKVAARADNVAIMALLLEKGVTLPTDGAASELMLAAVSGKATNAARFLLDHGFKANDPASQISFLERAIWDDADEVARLLIERGADVNARYEGAQTPLTQAVTRNKKELVALLLENKADPNLPNGAGKTPLDLASENSRKEVVALLKQKGAR